MIPAEYAIADVATSLTLGLPARNHGLLLCVDDDGRRWTAASDDVDYVRMIVSAPAGVARDLELPATKFPVCRAGWPDEWLAE